MISRLSAILHHLAPALPAAAARELARAPLGAAAGILVCAGLVALLRDGAGLPLHLIAPLGATAVLVFAVPNSPLAQPWSAVAGNVVSAAVAVAVVHVSPALLAPVLAVAAAILAMLLLRALHPPGGAVALLAALDPAGTEGAGLMFALAPVGLLTAALVLAGIAFHRFSGRVYPFRLVEDLPAPPSDLRLGLSEVELGELLRRFNQTPNIGVADLSRLLAAAEAEAAHHRFDAVTCGGVMTRDLITADPDTPLSEAVRLFRAHAIKSLPVVGKDGELIGLILQADLIAALVSGRASLPIPVRRKEPRARDIMRAAGAAVAHDLPVGVLLNRLARQGAEVVPVLRDGQLAGIITRSDILALLLKGAVRRGAS